MAEATVALAATGAIGSLTKKTLQTTLKTDTSGAAARRSTEGWVGSSLALLIYVYCNAHFTIYWLLSHAALVPRRVHGKARNNLIDSAPHPSKTTDISFLSKDVVVSHA